MKAIRLTITPKLLLVIALVAVLVVAVYAVTVLFTQTVPSATVKSPSSGSPSMTGDCSNLTLSPNTVTLSATNPISGVMNITCGGNGPAFTVASEGLFTASFSLPFGYQGLLFRNYTLWQGGGVDQYGYPIPGGCPGTPGYSYSVPGGSFSTLSKGDYVYCIQYYLAPYSTNSPTSIPSFSITWKSG